MNKTAKPIKLDWSKLTGFNQAKAIPGATSAKRTKSMIGNKVAQGVKSVLAELMIEFASHSIHF